MRQNKTKQMLQYWMDLLWQAGNTANQSEKLNWPDRTDIHPARCRTLLGDIFILERMDKDLVYRLAGTRLCALYGKELKQSVFVDAYEGTDRRSIEKWIEHLGLEDYVVLVTSSAQTATDEQVAMETLLLPLSHNGDRGNRVLGITVPCAQPYWLGAKPLVRQTIRSIRVLRPWESDPFLSSWPFKSPAEADLSTNRRTSIEAPQMYSEHQDEPVPGRTVGHLTVFDGGREEA